MNASTMASNLLPLGLLTMCFGAHITLSSVILVTGKVCYFRALICYLTTSLWCRGFNAGLVIVGSLRQLMLVSYCKVPIEDKFATVQLLRMWELHTLACYYRITWAYGLLL